MVNIQVDEKKLQSIEIKLHNLFLYCLPAASRDFNQRISNKTAYLETTSGKKYFNIKEYYETENLDTLLTLGRYIIMEFIQNAGNQLISIRKNVQIQWELNERVYGTETDPFYYSYSLSFRAALVPPEVESLIINANIKENNL